MLQALLLHAGVLAFTLVLLPGCGIRTLNTRAENPVLEDYVGGTWLDSKSQALGSLSTLASYRTVIVRLPGGKLGLGEEEAERVGTFCAEPPPDALESIASSFAAAAEVDGKGGGELKRAFGRGMSPLFIRSQGVQLYRDGMYNNCQAYLNGIRSKDEYIAYANFLLTQAVKIIEVEASRVEYKITGTIGNTPTVDASVSDRTSGGGTAASP